jgi:4-hydroxybenzoate polyprenyltransferase
MRTLTRFFLYSNLLIALCAMTMTWETLYFYTPGRARDAVPLLLFVGLSSLAAYGIHWLLSLTHLHPTPRIQWTRSNFRLMMTVTTASLAGTVVMFWPYRYHWIPVLPAAGLTLIYILPKVDRFRSLRSIAFGKTFLLATTWTYITSVMPLLIQDIPVDGPSLWFTLGRFFLVYTICLLFDHRDVEQDLREGITTLPARISEHQLTLIFFASLAACIFCMVLSLRLSVPDGNTLGTATSVWVLLSRLASPIILVLIFRKAIRSDDDFLYYGILDFLMMFSALLSFGMAF